MNLNLKVYFKDKIVKVKIYNKIKVKEVLNLLRHELRIPQENELILINDNGRLSDLEELTEKEMKNLKENWILLEDTDYDQQCKNETEKKRELTELDQNKIKGSKYTSNIYNSSVNEIRENRDKNKHPSNISMAEMIKLCTGADSLLKQSKIKKKRPFLRFYEYYGQNLHADDYEDDESSYEMDIYEESESDNNSPIDHLPHHIGHIISRSREQLQIINHALSESPRVQNLQRYSIQPEVVQAGGSRSNLNLHNPVYARPSIINHSNNSNSNQSLQNSIVLQNPFRIHRHPASRLINFDEALLTQLMAMGFSLHNSRIALRASHNNMEVAIHYLINAPNSFFEENEELAVENTAPTVVLIPQPNNNALQEIRPRALLEILRDQEPNELQRRFILNHHPNIFSSRLQELQESVDVINSRISNIQNIGSVLREDGRDNSSLENARENEPRQNNLNSDQPPIIELYQNEPQVLYSENEELPNDSNDFPILNISQSVYSEPISEVHAHNHHQHHLIRLDVPMDSNMLSEIQAFMAQRGYAMIDSSQSNNENAFQNEEDESDGDLF